jgi:hypothetical protein
MAESEPECGDSMDGESNELGKYAGTEVLDDCPLSRAQQTRNILLYASIIALVYLGSSAVRGDDPGVAVGQVGAQ